MKEEEGSTLGTTGLTTFSFLFVIIQLIKELVR